MTTPRPIESPQRPTAFWALAAIALAAAVALPFFQYAWSPERLLVIAGAELALAFLVLWLFDPDRFHWAGRGLLMLVFLAYGKHLVDELAARRTATEAILGFLILGVPALFYAVFGRFRGLGAEPETSRSPDGPGEQGPDALPPAALVPEAGAQAGDAVTAAPSHQDPEPHLSPIDQRDSDSA